MPAGRLKLILNNNEITGEPVPPPRDPEAWDGEEEARPILVRPEVRLARENLDIWIFGNMNTKALRREWMASVLEERVAGLASALS